VTLRGLELRLGPQMIKKEQNNLALLLVLRITKIMYDNDLFHITVTSKLYAEDKNAKN